jgi:hypothetical protein
MQNDFFFLKILRMRTKRQNSGMSDQEVAAAIGQMYTKYKATMHIGRLQRDNEALKTEVKEWVNKMERHVDTQESVMHELQDDLTTKDIQIVELNATTASLFEQHALMREDYAARYH